jgi:hypothetical protein
MYRSRPSLSPPLRPARPREEGEREAGSDETPLKGTVAGQEEEGGMISRGLKAEIALGLLVFSLQPSSPSALSKVCCAI